MGMCEKLKWNRKRLGMSQREFADLAGVSQGTIAKLERDETAWLTVRPSTEDRIRAHFSSMASWQPEGANKVIEEISNEVNTTYEESSGVTLKDNVGLTRWKEIEAMVNGKTQEEEKVNPVKETINIPIVNPVSASSSVTSEQKTLILMEFAYKSLVDATNHAEFLVAMNMIKRIANEY